MQIKFSWDDKASDILNTMEYCVNLGRDMIANNIPVYEADSSLNPAKYVFIGFTYGSEEYREIIPLQELTVKALTSILQVHVIYEGDTAKFLSLDEVRRWIDCGALVDDFVWTMIWGRIFQNGEYLGTILPNREYAMKRHGYSSVEVDWYLRFLFLKSKERDWCGLSNKEGMELIELRKRLF